MAYQVFARKYRPQTFGEVVGQEHVTRALRQALATGRAGHAYIFAGPRGVGKTTSARLLAKALNCEQPRDGEPCNQCPTCIDISRGTALDIIEIDAASYTGVDNIRELREQAMLVPVRAKRKVFILDEAHMLSKGAFNAFLKILEEPPAHVVFILATTESAQLPATVASRCQRFHFRRVGVAELVALLRDLVTREQITADDEALYLIARGVDGCVRDAESALEQVLAFASDGALTAAVVSAALGVVPQALALDLFAAVLADRGQEIITRLDEADREGHDPVRLAEAVLVLARIALLLRLQVPPAEIREAGTETVARIGELVSAVPAARVARLLDALLAAVHRMKQQEEHATTLLEVTLLRAGREALLPSLPELVAEVRALRNSADASAAPAPAPAAAVPAARPTKTAPAKPAAAGPRPAVPAWWNALLLAVRQESRQLHAVVAEATVTGYTDRELVLTFAPAKAYHAEQTEKQRPLLEGLMAKISGEKLQLRVTRAGGAAGPAPAAGGPAGKPAKAAPAPVNDDPLLGTLAQMFGGTVEKVDD